MNKISVGVWAYGACSDRYVGDGYRDRLPLEERIRHLGELPGVDGIEITYPGDFDEHTYPKYEPLLKQYGLGISSMGVEIVCDKQWQTGSFTSPDPAMRAKTISLVKKAMAFAEQIGVKVVSLWLGQDGFDYYFQADYVQQWNWLVEGLRECALSNPNVRLGLEYKVSEPRMSCMLKSAGIALSLAQATGQPNVGVTMDVGHAINAGECLGEVASILMAEKRLFHLHLNDNYRIADDDMPVGSVHFLAFAELFYWLQKLGYDGWYCMDLYPYRDSPDAAIEASVRFVHGMEKLVQKQLTDCNFAALGKEAPGKILSTLFDKIFGEDAQ